MIEFMGLPGAGKTTAAGRLQGDLIRSGRGCASVDDAFWSASRQDTGGVLKPLLLRLPRAVSVPLMGPMSRLDLGHLFLSRECAFCEIVFREMGSLPDSRQRQSFLYALLTHAVQREVIERHSPPGRLVVAEEGFAQRAMTLFGYRPEGAGEAGVAAYAGAMPKPAAVVWVDTAPEACAERLRQRPQPPYPLQSLAADRWPAQLALARRVLATTAAALEDSGVTVIRVSGERDDGAALAAEILDRL